MDVILSDAIKPGGTFSILLSNALFKLSDPFQSLLMSVSNLFEVISIVTEEIDLCKIILSRPTQLQYDLESN